MDRKGERRSMSHSDRRKKFRGNQHTFEEDTSFTSA